MSISILPPILEEELLSAYIDRVLTVQSRLTKRDVVATIFGRPWRAPSVQLPKHMSHVAEYFGDSLSTETCSQWIAAHTLYPFFANFLHEQAQEKLYQRMVLGGYGPLHQCGGRLVPRRKFVRVCVDCAQSDLKEFGFYRIFRAHVIPYVNRCAIHNRPLIEVVEYIAWSVPHDLMGSTNTTQTQAQLISYISSGLMKSQPRLAARGRLQEAIRGKLDVLGFLTPAGRLKLRTALPLLRGHYSTALLSTPLRETLNSSNLATYLRSTISSRQNIAPAAYLLLAAFTQERSSTSSEQVVMSTSAVLKRGARPTREELCAALTDFKSLRSAAVNLNLSVTTLSVVARKYDLEVGFRPSTATVGVRREALRLLRDGVAPNLVAQQLQISISAVYRIRASSAELANEISLKRFEQQRAKRRESFLALATTHPGLTGTGLRARDKPLWSWLYRNDRAWLIQATPAKSVPRAGVRPSIWPALESVLFPIIANAINCMVKKNRERITLTAIFKTAGVRQIARRKLVEMPALKVLIESAVEDPSRYVDRRLKTAADEIGASHLTSFSAIIRAARLRPTTVHQAGVDQDSWRASFALWRDSNAC